MDFVLYISPSFTSVKARSAAAVAAALNDVHITMVVVAVVAKINYALLLQPRRRQQQ